MKKVKFHIPITLLTIIAAVLSFLSTVWAIFSIDDSPSYEYTSIRGETVEIYGKGIYEHMPADVAIQGIAQDYITLFLALPLLLVSLYLFRKGKLKGKIMLSGLLLYFTVSYMIYLAMGMYNVLFLAYVAIVACSLLALVMNTATFNYFLERQIFSNAHTIRAGAWFLLVNCVLIALLWLSVIVPPLLDGSIYPKELYHFTTLIVQGLDLAIFLPLGFASAILALRRHQGGYFFTTIYLIFLSILMLALTSKVIFMALEGQNVVPVIFIMPTLAVIAMSFSILIIRKAKL